MKSAGRTFDPSSVQGHSQAPAGYGGHPPQTQSAPPMRFPSYTPVGGNGNPFAGTGINMNVGLDVDWENGGSEIFKGQQELAKQQMGATAVLRGFDFIGNLAQLYVNSNLATKYYETELDIAKLQQGVFYKQLDLKRHMGDKMDVMHERQTKSDQSIARISTQFQRQLNQDNNRAKQERLETVMANRAFDPSSAGRSDHFYGAPFGGIG